MGHIENVRDSKLIQLYVALTGSNLDGDVREEEVVKLLYAMLCIEKGRGYNIDYSKVFANKKDLVLIAKELVRIYDTPINCEVDTYPMITLASMLLNYMQRNEYSYKDIHSISGIVLKKSIIENQFC